MSAQGVSIADLMASSGVGFGTSGARGLVASLTDQICYLYTLGFLQYLRQTERMGFGGAVAIAGDLRSSTPRIMQAVGKAIEDFGGTVINCGLIPTPAVALFGITHRIPSIMVTGSHIPDDRNGIKFNQPSGEILKSDEAGIRQQSVVIPEGLFDPAGYFIQPTALPVVDQEARKAYLARYLELFPADLLDKKRIGLYQHSGVARELLEELLQALGAEVIVLGYSDHFVPVDTEAIRDEDIRLAEKWSRDHQLDALVSTDGDADRPLVSDEQGHWFRGDVAALLCARYLALDSVVTPVSSNTLAEKTGWFERVVRTRIGSPYVIEAMDELLQSGAGTVAGYEANGGFLLGCEISVEGHKLSPLPTRDAVIVILSLLAWSSERGIAVSALMKGLPERYTFSDRLRNFPVEKGRQLLSRLSTREASGQYRALETLFADHLGPINDVDMTDGLRATFLKGDIIHLRMSGNAPELRCYTESTRPESAEMINKFVLQSVQALQ